MSIFSDFKYHGYSNFKILYSLFFSRGASAVFIYRLAYWCYKHKLKFISIILYQLNVTLNCCEIAIGAEIGKGFRIVHSVGVVIGTVKAGENLTIYQNVSIGKSLKIDKDGRKSPIIGNNVNLFAGSVIAGPVIIGDNATIGANSVVQKDVPQNGKVLGARSVIIEDTALEQAAK